MTYSLDFREKMLAVKEEDGVSFATTAQRFDVGLSRVRRWLRNIVPKRTRKKPATKIDRKVL